MRNRQKSLERLLAVKTQLHQLEEAKLSEIQRRKQALAEERRAMFDLIGDAERTDGLILGLASRRIMQTDRGERDLDAAEITQKQALLKRTAQKKALEKIVKEAAQSAERESDRKTLFDIGERLASAPPTSLP